MILVIVEFILSIYAASITVKILGCCIEADEGQQRTFEMIAYDQADLQSKIAYPSTPSSALQSHLSYPAMIASPRTSVLKDNNGSIYVSPHHGQPSTIFSTRITTGLLTDLNEHPPAYEDIN